MKGWYRSRGWKEVHYFLESEAGTKSLCEKFKLPKGRHLRYILHEPLISEKTFKIEYGILAGNTTCTECRETVRIKQIEMLNFSKVQISENRAVWITSHVLNKGPKKLKFSPFGIITWDTNKECYLFRPAIPMGAMNTDMGFAFINDNEYIPVRLPQPVACTAKTLNELANFISWANKWKGNDSNKP